MSFLSQIHYQILGEPSEKPPMVFLHGLMGYGLNWRRIASSFKNDRQVLIFDQRGHGKSFKPKTGYQPEDYADDLALILNELGWSSVDLVGHSMGGRNALNFASRFSMKVRRLVIVDIGPEVTPDSLDRIRNLINLVPVPFENKLQAKEFFLNEFPKLLAKQPQANTLGQYFYSNMEELENGGVGWRFDRDAIMSSLIEGRKGERWQEWESLTMPTLIIRGEHSPDLLPSTYEQMLLRNRLSRGVEIKNAGHWVHFEQPEAFIRTLRNFLDRDENEIFREDFDFLTTSS